MEIINNSSKYDVIVVGSGAGGGMATKILSDAGLKIAVVEALELLEPLVTFICLMEIGK